MRALVRLYQHHPDRFVAAGLFLAAISVAVLMVVGE